MAENFPRPGVCLQSHLHWLFPLRCFLRHLARGLPSQNRQIWRLLMVYASMEIIWIRIKPAAVSSRFAFVVIICEGTHIEHVILTVQRAADLILNNKGARTLPNERSIIAAIAPERRLVLDSTC